MSPLSIAIRLRARRRAAPCRADAGTLGPPGRLFAASTFSLLDSREPLLRPALQPRSQVALALDIGLAKGTYLTSPGRDLDNYLFPNRRPVSARPVSRPHFARKQPRAVDNRNQSCALADEPAGHWAQARRC
jgi:hypothetical protein